MGGIFWALVTIVGPIMLAIGVAYAVVSDKFQRHPAERAPRQLRDDLDREDHAREA